MTDLTGHTALITGASSGLGVRFAHVMAQAGARVIITARRAEKLQQVEADILAQGGTAKAVSLDVTDLDGIEGFFEGLKGQDMMPDILVNNAGMNVAKPALENTPEDYRQVLDTNLTAPFFLSTAFARHHIAAENPARIINIASVGGYRVLPGNTSYCVSKSGIIMMTRSLAREWARYNINVNAICPGSVKGDRIDGVIERDAEKRGLPASAIRDVYLRQSSMRVFVDASEIAETVKFLCSPAGHNISGQALAIDGHTEGLSNWID